MQKFRCPTRKYMRVTSTFIFPTSQATTVFTEPEPQVTKPLGGTCAIRSRIILEAHNFSEAGMDLFFYQFKKYQKTQSRHTERSCQRRFSQQNTNIRSGHIKNSAAGKKCGRMFWGFVSKWLKSGRTFLKYVLHTKALIIYRHRLFNEVIGFTFKIFSTYF
jgi:hypothetical protein